MSCDVRKCCCFAMLMCCTAFAETPQVDYVEEAAVELMLMDLEVYDEEGRPVSGLVEGDFTLTIDGRFREIYSVDDLCRCVPRTAAPIDNDEEAKAQPAKEPLEPSAEPMLYVFYLNFGQLAQDGRAHALAEARRWIWETMQVGDRVQILAWSSQAGLRRLTPVSSEKDVLLRAIDEADRDPAFNDPLPAVRTIRQDEIEQCFRYCTSECRMCELRATDYAQQEYAQGKWSMRALQQALYSLEQISGSKTLLYFYQNDALYPARLFIGVQQRHIQDQVRELEQTAADANLSRTNIVAAYSGSDPEPSAINVGANLADYTGGSYSRAAYLTPSITSGAGRGCRCLYRIAVRPPQSKRHAVYNASVWVRDRRAPRRFRLQHLSRFERWLRDARAALTSPELVSDLPVAASVVPLSWGEEGWEIAVQIAISTDALLLLPTSGGVSGSWEAGALLYRDDGGDPKEFLARSWARIESDDPSGNYVVHEHIIEKAQPGGWRLGAFVRDGNARVFGGAESGVVLPTPGKAGISTPLLMRDGRPWLRTELPVLKKNNPEPSRTGVVVRAPLPLSDQAVLRGDPLEVHTWVCAPRKGEDGRLLRYLARGEEPLFRFERADQPAPGSCSQLVDRIDTGFLFPSEYTYHIRYQPSKDAEPLEDGTAFVLGEQPHQ